MAKASQVDVRKLKDEVAEHLKRSRWEKAAEVLEQLVAAEPKDMAQQLRLGDTYRRMEQPQKAIESYQRAAKFFSDEGQLIKAIGAVKLILECDPRNAQAQKQLADMNQRRMGKMPLAKVGIKSVPAQAAAPARAAKASAMDAASGAIHAVDDPSQIELPPVDEDEPLELDDGRAPSQAAARPRTTKLPPRKAKSFDLSGGDELELDPPIRAPTARSTAVAPASAGREIDLELDPDVPVPEAELLPDEAILTPEPEDLVAPEHEDEVISREEFGRQGGPIVDLLSSGAEEEIELLSISADEEVSSSRPTGPPTVSADDADLDRAFGNIAPEGAGVPTKVVTRKVPLFDDLPQDAFVALVNRLGYHRHGAGHLIIREGEPGRSFFIIVEGRVRVYKAGADGKEITLAHLGEGAFFGEMAMLSGAPRTANVVSEEETEILEVTDTVLRDLATKHPQVVNSLKNFYRQRLLNNVMAISPLFKDFDPAQRKALVEKFRMRQAAPEEKVIAEGKSTDGLYVVLHGVVDVTVEQRQVARLREGEIFGEMSLLSRDPASATVTAKSNAILLRLPRDSFQELVVTHPQILELVSDLAEKRRTEVEAIRENQGGGQNGMSFL